MTDNEAIVRQLLAERGRTFCEQSGFTLKDKPSPLFQLLVLSILLAKPISADIATAASAELRRIGVRTARGTLHTDWQQRVDALGRARYKRYDESTATRLEQVARLVLDRWQGDLRRLAAESDHDPGAAADLLTEIPGIGPAGADIFLREAQAVWHWCRPHLDARVVDGARRAGLPSSGRGLTRVFEGRNAAELGAALVRVTTEESSGS